MSKATEHVQQSSQGALVELFQLDLTPFGDQVYHLVGGDTGSQAHQVSFGGQAYVPHPIRADGFELSGTGPLPKPSFAIANVGGLFTQLVVNHRDLLGAELTRIRTFDRYLDGGADPDPTVTLPIDVYILTRKTRHTRKEIQWELSAAMDQEGAELPNRVVTRDHCDHSYRSWSDQATFSVTLTPTPENAASSFNSAEVFLEASGFSYEGVTCPYAGAAYFDQYDNPTSADKDICGKRLGSCRLRFGANAVLPYRGFPGVARMKIR